MPRTFNGTTDNLRTSLGGINATVTAITYALIVRRGANGAWHGVIDLVDSGGSNILALELSAGNAIDFNANMASGSASSFTVQTTDGQVLLAVTKATGTVTPRMHKYVYSSDTWTHSAGSLTVANPSGTAASVRFGQWETTDFYQGDIIAAAVWNRDLTDTEIEQLGISLIDWHALVPAALWVFDQQATGQTVPDLTGGGANQNAITGTTVSTTSPVVWSYGHDVSAPHSVPAGGGTTFPVSLSGGVTPSAGLARQAGRGIGGTITPTGAVIKQTRRTVAGTANPTGVLLKQLARALTGTISPAGAVTLIRTRLLALAGAITPAGTLTRASAKPLAGATTPTGSVSRQPRKTFAGTVTPTGLVAIIRTRLVALAGAITPTGTLARRTAKPIAGSVTPAGSMSRSLARRLTGGITPSGTIATARTAFLAVAGTVTPVGAIVKRTARTLLGNINPAGAALKLLGRLFAGDTMPAGAVGLDGGDLAPVITPPERTFAIPADNRTVAVDTDYRSVIIPVESRTLEA